MRLTRARFAPLLVACSLAAACGSTAVPDAQSLAAGSAVQDGLSAPAAVGEAGPAAAGAGGVAPGAADQTLSSGPGSSARAVTGAPGGSAAAPSGPGGAGTARGPGAEGPAGAAAMGPGITAKTISLGIPYCADCAQANAAIGAAAGADSGDPRQYYEAVLDDINQRGGLLGRKVVPVFEVLSAKDNFDASSQAACETFTKDNKVFATFLRGALMADCAKKAGIINVGELGSGPAYARYPNVFAPHSVRLERLAAVTVRAMVAANWHKPEPKWPTGRIGLVTWENPEYEYAMSKGSLVALRAAGLEETDVRYIAVPQNANAIADASAAISSAILAFREKGIDHVLIADGPAGIFAGGGLTLLFLNNAQSQQYFPRYGFNSSNFPGSGTYPAEQQSGMLAVTANSSAPGDEGIAANPERERCIALMKKRGLSSPGQDAAIACEIGSFVEAILKRAKGTTLPDVIATVEGLGTSYRSLYSYGNRFSPTQHDGAALFRNARFDDGCTCMKYTSKPYEP